ncbi:hypothetical protein MKW92_030012, partial [Papaver armeniacum]
RSDLDDGRWEREDTPHRDGHSTPKRSHRPSPALMLVGSSPDDALLMFPWVFRFSMGL